MAPRAAGIHALDRRGVREAVGEAERVVHVMDMAAGDPEMALDLRRGEREGVRHEGRGARREAIADPEQMAHVPPLLGLPGGPFQLVGHPLHEERRVVVPGRVAQRWIDRGVDVPLDGGEPGQAARLHIGEGLAHRAHHFRLVGQEVHGAAELAAVLRQAGEARQSAQREIDLERRAIAPVAIDPGIPRAGEVLAADQIAQPERIGVHHHRPGPDLAAAAQMDGERRGRDRLHRAAGLDGGARFDRRRREPRRHRAHAALHDHPRPVAAGQPAHVVDEEVHPRSRRVPIPVQAGEAVGHGVHGLEQVAAEFESVQIVPNGLAAQIDEHPPQRGADVLFRGLLDREGLLEPGRRHVLAQLRDLPLQLLVRAPVLLAEEGEELFLHRGSV